MNHHSLTFFSKELLLLLLALLVLSLWRYHILSHMADSSLYVDEAQYWFWSQHLDFGFYSKPPVIALIIFATTNVCGEGETCIRLGSVVIYPLTSLLIYASASFLFNRRIGLVSALVFITLPAVSLSSLIISTDIALFFFWALAFYAFLRAMDSNAWHWWLLVGFAGGMGMESKYTMGIFAFSVFAYLLTTKRLSFLANLRLWTATGLALMLWLPNLWWNAQHDYITFVHTSEISAFDTRLFHWDELGNFLLGQGLVFGPVLFVLFLIFSVKKTSKHTALLMSFSWMFLGIIILQAFLGRANANWAAPAYVSASILVTAALLQQHRIRLLIIAVAINLSLAVVIYYPQTVLKLTGYNLTSKTDLRKRLRGWRDIGAQYKIIQARYPQAILLGTDRTLLSHLVYHAKPKQVMTWNPQQKIRHHYDLHAMLKNPIQDQKFLLVTDEPLPQAIRESFQQIEALTPLNVQVYHDLKRHYQVYLLHDFNGYSS
ncbi:MAG: glycosyltransferase family 39 protein [Cocleimonas sp.]|nr:glycosyltransferase family 39 protein [Cocleimonas sp.]